MSTNSSLLQIGTLEVLVIRKPIKNLHLAVLPPDGRIRVSSPLRMKDDAIRTLIATRIPWIRKQQLKFKSQERQSVREYISGESHYFFGRRFQLEIIYRSELPKVSLKGNSKIILQIRPRTLLKRRQEIMMNWYRQELRRVGEELFKKWQKRIGVKAKSWSIKKMKTRWGTCNPESERIWLNLELIKKPSACIEYVVVHELVHLLERKHTDRFVKLMTKFLPKWQSSKEELNRLILSYEKWTH